ncbi:MAG: hypothetical protein AAGD04_14390 [Pseudomonadota bacterium]
MTKSIEAPSLEDRLLSAHKSNDKEALVGLYEEACHTAKAAGNEQGAGFYMTHAYVFALEIGHPRTQALRAWLIKEGREPEA